jgi:D-glycero-D-manno-heptose 1,7-bisphosphate phosphatase
MDRCAQMRPIWDDEFNLVNALASESQLLTPGTIYGKSGRMIMDEGRHSHFLIDREGVINRRHSSGRIESWEDFEFLPRALQALRLLAENHFVGIVISRQPPICRAAASSNEPDAITRRLLLEVALSGGHIAQVYYCRHRIEDGCNCYDPSVGMLAKAKAEHRLMLEDTYFVSEEAMSLRVAAEAGCPCIKIQRDAFLQPHRSIEEPYGVASNLYEAAEQILASAPVRQREFQTLHA